MTKRLPYIALAGALALAGLLFLKSPTGTPAELPRTPLVEPALAAPWPVALRLSPVARAQLVREVVDGRRSLLSAASLFGELNRVNGQLKPGHRLNPAITAISLPGNTAKERLCQQVEVWVRVALRDDPARRNAVLGRLQAEFNAAPREFGDIRLPDAARLEPVEQLLTQARESLPERERNLLH